MADRNFSRILARFQSVIVAEITASLKKSADELAVDVKKSLDEGAIRGAGHKPSTPGTPPNSDTGRLEDSVGSRTPAKLRAQVYANTPYATIQEFGGNAGGASLPERPYMRPALAQKRRKIVTDTNRAVSRALRRAASGV